MGVEYRGAPIQAAGVDDWHLDWTSGKVLVCEMV
jgi:hypothetical protein